VAGRTFMTSQDKLVFMMNWLGDGLDGKLRIHYKELPEESIAILVGAADERDPMNFDIRTIQFCGGPQDITSL